MIKRTLLAIMIGLGLTAALVHPVLAQEAKAKPSGLSKNSKDPINIEADGLEVFDKEGKAVYSGNVIVTQGETVMKAKKMLIFYVRSEEGQADPAEGDAGAAIKRVEAEGDVIILEKDQIATGEKGVYEATTDIMTMTGNVALSKGQNVTKGQKLVYNLGTGVATVDAGGTGRVSSSFVSGGGDPKKPAAAGKTPKP
ncbi:MAG: lipopolysaccharide transport periplasmic protein LptA [Hyphomicrobiales bacterium]